MKVKIVKLGQCHFPAASVGIGRAPHAALYLINYPFRLGAGLAVAAVFGETRKQRGESYSLLQQKKDLDQ